MLTGFERRCATVGASALLAHILISASAAFVTLNRLSPELLHVCSATLYLIGYLALAALFYSRFRISSVIFAVMIAAGIIDGILLDVLLRGGITETIIDSALPLSFLVFGTMLVRVKGVLRWIGLGYLFGSMSWLVSIIPHASMGLVSTTSFFAEFAGMNATVAMIVWAFYVARRNQSESAVRSDEV